MCLVSVFWFFNISIVLKFRFLQDLHFLFLSLIIMKNINLTLLLIFTFNLAFAFNLLLLFLFFLYRELYKNFFHFNDNMKRDVSSCRILFSPICTIKFYWFGFQWNCKSPTSKKLAYFFFL